MMQNFHLEAHKYIGVPFKHNGRTNHGLDCLGLLFIAGKACGYTGLDDYIYGRQPLAEMFVTGLRKHIGTPVDDEPRINDVVLMRLGENLPPSHLGIITHHPNGLGIIHAYTEAKRVVYHRLSNKIKKHIVGVYRWAF